MKRGVITNCDMHVHTGFSCDSDALMERYCSMGKEKNLEVICFTDHVDFNRNDYGYGYYEPEKYFNEFSRMKGSSNITLLSGIEFSEPHLYYKQLDELAQYPYDFIIGSVHWVGNMFPCAEVRERITAKEFYSLYWNEVLKTVERGGFDCLGHIDFPKRYYKEIIYDEKVIQKIFTIMCEKGIVLEINTSSLRKGLTTTMPDRSILQLYKQCGGEFVTIGSDSHIEEDVGEGIEYALRLMESLELKQVIFRRRKMEVLSGERNIYRKLL